MNIGSSDEEAEFDPQFSRVEDEVVDEEVHSSSEEEFEGRSSLSNEQNARWSPREDEDEEDSVVDDEDEDEDEDADGNEEEEDDERSFQQDVEAMALSKEERKMCKKFASHVTNSAIANGWEEHETARMIHLFVGSLGMTIEKIMAFLNDLKLGSPILLSSLCQLGIDFTPGQIISMMKVDSWEGK